jgi:N-acyl-D-amino-acid deacylase
MPYDLIIKNGLVYDGSEESPKICDIGIANDRIVAVGAIDKLAKRTIDATGLIVTPGFIDIHTHQDWFDFKSHEQDLLVEDYNNLYQGVTTIITGLCGAGVPDIDEWYGFANKIGLTTNVYHLIPHGSLRDSLFGQATKLTYSQLAIMKEKVADQMKKGALGLSTGLIYVPGCHSDTEELVELCKAMKPYNGIYVSHVRGEDGKSVLAAYKEAIDIGREAHVGVEISHMKVMKPYIGTSARDLLKLIDDARNEGLDITGDQYPYEACATILPAFLPATYRTPLGIKEEYKSGAGREELRTAVHDYLSVVAPNEILILDNPADPSMNGKYINEIAQIQDVSPEDAFLDTICRHDCIKTVFFVMNDDDIRLIMQKEYVFTASDQLSLLRIAGSSPSLFHPRAYGTFARKISKFAMEEHVISVNQAIRSMTSLPAQKFHLTGRGEIKVGNYADIAVIDLAHYKDVATYTNTNQYARGVEYVIVNGIIELDYGVVSNKRGAQLLRSS